MQRRYIDLALMSICGLLAAVVVWFSAAGCEKVGMVILGISVSFGVITVGLIRLPWSSFKKRSEFSAIIGTLACLAVVISVVIAQWPLRITYAMSRNAFDSFAQRVRTGAQLKMPKRVGFFTIRKAEVYYNGIVCLWTRPLPGGNTGFVQCRRDHVPFNLWSMVKLDDRWQFISED